MNLRKVAEEIMGMDALEHLIRKNWQPGSENMVIAKLSNDNFVPDFVKELYKKTADQKKNLPDNYSPEPTAVEIEQYMLRHGASISREDAILEIKLLSIGAIDMKEFSSNHQRTGIYEGQDSINKYFYHPDKNGKNIKDPSFTMEVLCNISDATQDLVKRALDNDFKLALRVKAQHFDKIADNSGRIGAPSWYRGDQYQASGELKIF